MKKLLVASLVMAALASGAMGEVKVVTPELTFYPTRNAGRIARLVLDSSEKGSWFVLIKDSKGQFVRCIATGPQAAGRMSVDWDGKDATGAVVQEGTYTAFLTTGLKWELDKSFGKDGRIGRSSIVQTVDDPEKMEMPSPGEIFQVRVNDKEYYKADDLAIAGPNYAVVKGVLQVNPLAGAKKGDKLTVDYYYPAYFSDPWDVALDDSNALYVLLRPGRLVKITPDGKGVDKGFADGGMLPPFGPSQQVVVSSQDKRIYIAGSQSSGHGTGVFSLDTGAFLYEVGGWAGMADQRSTGFAAGICLGKENRIYINCSATLMMYDRTKEGLTGFLYSAQGTTRQQIQPPLWGVYWGPSLEAAMDPDMFYAASWTSVIHKFRENNGALGEAYYIESAVVGDPMGLSLDRKTGLLFAALRTASGEVAVFSDDGFSIKETMRLKDPDLGPTHAVRYRDGSLYVVEDGSSLPEGALADRMRKANLNPQGRNRLSRYLVSFEKETELTTIERK